MIILPLQEQVYLFWEALLERGSMEIQTYSRNASSISAREVMLCGCLLFICHRKLSKAPCTDRSLLGVTWNTICVPCHTSLCAPGKAGLALDEPFGHPPEQEISRREEDIRKSVKEKEGWPWSWELESGWWGDEFIGRPKG